MARRFDGTNDYFSIPTQTFGGTPNTMAAWFWLDDVGATVKTILGAGGTFNGVQEYAILANGAAFWALTQNNTNVQAISTATLIPKTWYHGCGVFASATDRRAFVNGRFKGTDANNKVPGAATPRTCIGDRGAVIAGQKMKGMIAEVAIWQTALTDLEVEYLATGVPAYMVHPEKLCSYWALRSMVLPEQDYTYSVVAGVTPGPGKNMVATGRPTVAAHPPAVPYNDPLAVFLPLRSRHALPATPVKTRSFIVIMG